MYDSSTSPLVSIIVPAFNAEKTISDTLHSIINQSYQNLEIIVVDDGSVDRTVEIVQRIAVDDRRIKLIRQSNAGVAQARNTAIRAATGCYIAPIDADDLWYPSKIEKQLDVIRQNRNIGLVYTWVRHIDERNMVTGSSQPVLFRGYVFSQHVLKNFIGNGSSILVPTDIVRAAGGYDPALRAQQAEGAEDYKLQLKIAESYEFDLVPEYLTGYRRTPYSMSANSKAMYKSKELVLREAATNNRHIPDYLFRWGLAGPQYSHGRSLIRKNTVLLGIQLLCRSLWNDPVRIILCVGGEFKSFLTFIKNHFRNKKKTDKKPIKFLNMDPVLIAEKKVGFIETFLKKRMDHAQRIDTEIAKSYVDRQQKELIRE